MTGEERRVEGSIGVKGRGVEESGGGKRTVEGCGGGWRGVEESGED